MSTFIARRFKYVLSIIKKKRKRKKKKNECAKDLSARAGLLFSVEEIQQTLAGQHAQPVDEKAAVFLTGVLEYLVLEILTLAGQTASLSGSNKITLHHLPGLQDKKRYATLLKLCKERQSCLNDFIS